MFGNLSKKDYKEELSLYIFIKMVVPLLFFGISMLFLPIPSVPGIINILGSGLGNISFFTFLSKLIADEPDANEMVKYIFLLISFLWIIVFIFSFSHKQRINKIVTCGVILLEFAEFFSFIYFCLWGLMDMSNVLALTILIVGIAFRLLCIALIITAYIKSHRNPQKAVSGQVSAENSAETQLPDTPADGN